MVRQPAKVAANVVAMVAVLGSAGCATVVVEAAKKTMEDRVTSDQVTDTQIAAGILSALGSSKEKGLIIDISTDVWEQRVMLTGTVVDARVRTEATRAAYADKRVRRVYDEIQVVSQAEQDRRREAAKNGNSSKKEGFDRAVNDFWIETKISAQLITTSGITSVNYRWRCVRNVVYLIGRARTQSELNNVLSIIRATEGVSQVKHFVQIKPAPN
jgi:osmotically-inducible protein OsmY